MKQSKTQVYILLAGTSVWMLAMAVWFSEVLQGALNFFNTFIMALIVLIGAMWLEQFLHTRALPFTAIESANLNERRHRILMDCLGSGLAVVIGAMIIMWVWFPENLFEIKLK